MVLERIKIVTVIFSLMFCASASAQRISEVDSVQIIIEGKDFVSFSLTDNWTLLSKWLVIDSIEEGVDDYNGESYQIVHSEDLVVFCYHGNGELNWFKIGCNRTGSGKSYLKIDGLSVKQGDDIRQLTTKYKESHDFFIKTKAKQEGLNMTYEGGWLTMRVNNALKSIYLVYDKDYLLQYWEITDS